MARPLRPPQHAPPAAHASEHRRQFFPRLDATSLLSILVVLAATAALPPQGRLALLASEIVFAASSAVRIRRHNVSIRSSCGHRSSLPECPAPADPGPRPDPALSELLGSTSGPAATDTATDISYRTANANAIAMSLGRSPPLHAGQLEDVHERRDLDDVTNPAYLIRTSGQQPRRLLQRGVSRFALWWLLPQWRGSHAQMGHDVARRAPTQIKGEGLNVKPLAREAPARKQQLLRLVPGQQAVWCLGLVFRRPPGEPPCAAVGPRPSAWSAVGGSRQGPSGQRECPHDSLDTLEADTGLDLDAVRRAELLLAKLLDPREGHLDLLQGGHLLTPWFNGLAGPHQLNISHVTQLLAYLLLPPPSSLASASLPLRAPLARQMPPPLAASELWDSSAGSFADELPLNDGSCQSTCTVANSGGESPSAVASALSTCLIGGGPNTESPARISPDIPALASRLMDLLGLPTCPESTSGLYPRVADGDAASGECLDGSEQDDGVMGGLAKAAVQVAEAAAAVAEAAETAAFVHGAASSESAGTQSAARYSQETAIPSASTPGVAPVGPSTPSPGPAAPSARLLACTSDPLVASYRPLVFYLLTEAVAGATHLALVLMGFRVAGVTRGGTATVYEWRPRDVPLAAAAAGARQANTPEGTAASAQAGPVRGSASPDSDVGGPDSVSAPADGGFRSKTETLADTALEQPITVPTPLEDSSGAATPFTVVPPEEAVPLVFLHGIGLGLTPYLRLLGRLVAASGGRRRVFAVQYKHVSMRLTANIPAPHQVAADVAAFLACKGVTRMSLLAHSYGTLVASALTKLAVASSAAPAVSRLTLVDPVCFAMFLPHLVRNAIYQQPVDMPTQPPEPGPKQQPGWQQAQQPEKQQHWLHAPVQRTMDLVGLPGDGDSGESGYGAPWGMSGASAGSHRHDACTDKAESGNGELDAVHEALLAAGSAVEGWQSSCTRPTALGLADSAANLAGRVECSDKVDAAVGVCTSAESAPVTTAAANSSVPLSNFSSQSEGPASGEEAADGAAAVAGPPRIGPLGLVRRRLVRTLLRGLVVAEFHCSVALRRRLDWAHVNLWPSELPAQATVVLSGRDNLVPVKEVRRILANRAALMGPEGPHPTVLFHPDLGHGGFLSDETCQAQVLAAALDVPLDAVKAAVAAAKPSNSRGRNGGGGSSGGVGGSIRGGRGWTWVGGRANRFRTDDGSFDASGPSGGHKSCTGAPRQQLYQSSSESFANGANSGGGDDGRATDPSEARSLPLLGRLPLPMWPWTAPGPSPPQSPLLVLLPLQLLQLLVLMWLAPLRMAVLRRRLLRRVPGLRRLLQVTTRLRPSLACVTGMSADAAAAMASEAVCRALASEVTEDAAWTCAAAPNSLPDGLDLRLKRPASWSAGLRHGSRASSADVSGPYPCQVPQAMPLDCVQHGRPGACLRDLANGLGMDSNGSVTRGRSAGSLSGSTLKSAARDAVLDNRGWPRIPLRRPHGASPPAAMRQVASVPETPAGLSLRGTAPRRGAAVSAAASRVLVRLG